MSASAIPTNNALSVRCHQAGRDSEERQYARMPTDKESYLVIGGAGFVGGWVVQKLLERNAHSVTVFDVRETKIDPRVKSIVGDLRSLSDVVSACEGKTVVIHTASPPHDAGPKVYFPVNVDGTRNVIDACVKCGVKKLIYTSSSSVVFKGQDLIDADEKMPHCEVFPDEYNESKAKAEQLVLEANGKGGLLTISLRPAGIFGPRDTQAIRKMYNAAISGKHRTMLGQNRTLLDYTYVENIAYALVLAADKLAPNNGTAGEAFFITNDAPLYFWDLPKMIFEGLDIRPSLYMSVPFSVAFPLAYVADAIKFLVSPFYKMDITFSVFVIKQISVNRCFNIEKAKKLLGYEPIVPMDEAVKRTVDWLKEVQKNGGKW
ncbi:hypothetical protein HK102_008602 [Quaeritorhiza haematococci]|nr:hypothetical protein HK102_008602 [Quaeritorhiza haematococci]